MTCFLPGGIVSIVLISISPYSVEASVRGIGVALISRKSAFSPFARSALRCSTPNRCCSSAMTRPRSANSTRSWIRLCVPIRISALPVLTSSSTSSCCFEFIPAYSALVLTPMPFSNAETFASCWEASISVGASSAACWPDSTQAYMAIAATSVLPQPTSP